MAVTPDNSNTKIEKDSIKDSEVSSKSETKCEVENKKGQEKATEAQPKKKGNPFLSSEVKAETEEENQQEATSKKQYEIIDNLSKDSSIFNNVGKLYFFSKKTNKPETRGEGKFLILKDDSGMYKLTMIRDKFMLKGCNHYISPNCPLQKASQAKNSWIWTAIGDKSDAEKNEEKTVYFAMFKDEETSNVFQEKYSWAQQQNSKLIKSKKAQ